VFTVSALDAQGRAVPTAQNKISFAIEGAGKILGVGNGDPSCHEPDTFIAGAAARTVPVNNWHWEHARVPSNGEALPEYAPDFNDTGWNIIKPKTDGDTGDMFLKENQTAVYRAHVSLAEADLNSPNIRIRFGTIDDHGWVFVNNHLVGESHDWQDQPAFDIKKFLHAGDNVIAVGVKNDASEGGLDPNVNVDIVSKVDAAQWSRSLFNGLAQIIVQSTRDAGEIKLSATADGLAPVAATVETQPSTTRAFVP
jgi:beta-galactosidase